MKKIFITAGSLLTIAAPVVTVISCGTKYVEPTEQQLDDYKDLTSEPTLRILENQWQYLVLGWEKDTNLNQTFDNIASVSFGTTPEAQALEAEVLDVAKQIITVNIESDPAYLENFGETLLNSNGTRPIDETNDNAYTDGWLRENGLLTQYNFGIIFDDEATTPIEGLSSNALKLLISDDRITFKSTLLKTLVARQYLQITKDDWAATYPSKATSLSRVQQAIDPASFVLIREMLSKKYFAKWNISLDAETSRNLLDLNDQNAGLKTYDETYNALKIDGAFGSEASYSQRQSTIPLGIFDFSILSSEANPEDDPYLGDDLVAYTGIDTYTEGDAIKFSTLKDYEEIDSYDDWSGFIIKDEFVTKDDGTDPIIPWLGEDNEAEVGELTFVKGIMPIYKNIGDSENEEMRLTIDTEAQKDAFITLFAILDSSLYSDAMDYYTTRVEDSNVDDGDTSREPIILKIIDQKYFDILDQELHLKFIKEQEVED